MGLQVVNIFLLFRSPLNSAQKIGVVFVKRWVSVADLARFFVLLMSEKTVIVELPSKRLVKKGLILFYEYLFDKFFLVMNYKVSMVRTPLNYVISFVIIDDGKQLSDETLNSLASVRLYL